MAIGCKASTYAWTFIALAASSCGGSSFQDELWGAATDGGAGRGASGSATDAHIPPPAVDAHVHGGGGAAPNGGEGGGMATGGGPGNDGSVAKPAPADARPDEV